VISLLLAALIIWQGFSLHQRDLNLARIARERDKVLAELERSNQDLNQFAYMASHDLQEPLLSMGGFVQLLQQTYQGRLDEQADDWINRSVESARRMQTMIRDILTYARIGSRAQAFEPISLAEVFAEVTAMLAAAIRDAAAEVTCDDLPTVPGNRTQLTQLLLNLIGNALKYRSEEPPQIHVSAQPQGSAWRIGVRDNGIGIALKHQPRIFEAFRRLHSQREYPGTGIGLALCRRVVERYGGQIWVESADGQGSTFYFTLPVDAEA
jgi:light-regulated signal transduction histidine kinase (bacteriophytochrome)